MNKEPGIAGLFNFDERGNLNIAIRIITTDADLKPVALGWFSFTYRGITPTEPMDRSMTKTTFLPLILLGGMLLSAPVTNAQQFSITAGSISTCTGVLEDSGGPAAGYGNNENFTVVICPLVAGDAISLFWVVFNLSTQTPDPIDRIRIWDGDNTGATSLGEYTGTALQGLTVSATTFNPTGCLTVQFLSNANGVGDFAASILCFTPCDRPTAVATMSEPGPALVCLGEVIEFDGSTSYAAPGFDIVDYTWVFADGTTGNGPTVSHAFTEPGEYIVQLNLIDNNDCVNSNVVDLQVLVSTQPTFVGTMESVESCLGAEIDLSAVVTPITWTGIPEANFGDGIFLPDDVGQPFSSDLTFTQFAPGQTLTNLSDLLSICVSMEHSFMGDLVLSVACPSGQNMIFHQQGGGGTYIGGAYDLDNNNNPIPGDCWDYCWSPTATNGTWVQAVAAGQTMMGGTPANNALVPGTYSPVQPFSNLIGCPLNGTWTFTSLDLWGADNGHLCSWSINFNPAIIPDVTQFTPALGTSTLDSAYWSGPAITLDPTNPLIATANPTMAGTFNYTFIVLDNFGCSYDTTVSVTIAPQMEIDAGPAIVLCNDPEPMAGQITANGPPSNCVWTLQLNESFGDTWNGGANVQVIIDGVSTSYSITTGGVYVQTHALNVSTGASIVVQFTAGAIWNNENSFSLINDQGATVYASPPGPPTGVSWSGTATCDGGTSASVFQWNPATGLDDPTDPTTMVFVTQPTWFYLSAWPDGSPECAVTDSVLVSPDPSINAGENNALTVCENQPAFLMTDSLSGTADPGGVWTASNGAVVPAIFDPLSLASDLYTYTVTSAAGCVATSDLEITVIPASDPTCCGIPDAGEPAYSCNLTIALSATPGNTGVGNWVGPQGSVFENAFEAVTSVTVQPGMGGAHWFYWVENDGAFCNLIDSVEMTFTDAIMIDFTWTDAICLSYCDGTVQASMTGGNAIAGFTYEWSNGDSGVELTEVTGLCAGDYDLTITDDNGCTGSNDITIGEPVLLEIDSLATQPVTCSGDCDGIVEIYDQEAVEYSFNDGASWTLDNIRPFSCEGIYDVLIRDAAGCIGEGMVAVTGPPPVIADFVWGPIPANVNNPTIYFSNTSENADHYWWDIAGERSTEETDPVHVFSNKEPGVYEVCLVAFNFNECSDTICYMVVIDDVLFTYLPNSFTPDGDGLNEGFMMSTNIDVITDFEMMIFDRWGQMLFTTKDPYQPWFGSYNNSGEVLKSDVYAYRITYEIRGTDARRELVGHVTLLK